MAAGAVEEVLQRGDGGRHRLLETHSGATSFRAELGQAITERLRAGVAQRGAAWVVGAQIGDQPVAEIVDGNRFHRMCLGA